VFLFARSWTPDNTATASRQNPGAGVTLSRWSGELVADLEVDGVSRTDGTADDPYAGCNIELDPGVYILCRPEPTGATLEQTVIASRDWQTQLFLLKRGVAARFELSAPSPSAMRVDDAAVLMTRGGFDPDRSDMKLAELARIAVADERRILSDDLRQMAEGKFQNPMLGIFAAHILDLSLERARQDAPSSEKSVAEGQPPPSVLKTGTTADDLNVLVDNLRSLVGNEHPDVEALSLQCPDPQRQTKRPLLVAPMLRRSWSLYVKASNKRPRLVPTHLWDRISTLTALVPFLAWLPEGTRPSKVDAADEVARAITGGSKGRKPLGPLRVAKGSPSASSRVSSGGAYRVSGLRAARASSGSGGPYRSMKLYVAGPEIRRSVEIEPSRASATPSPRRRPMPGSVKESVSVAHDIPRAALDRAFRRL
jgi:hypothetical protein